jgi:hypothetical protein
MNACDPSCPQAKAIDVIDVLSDLFILRGVPAHIRSDNALEFVYAHFATDAATGYETDRDARSLKSVKGAPMASLVDGSVTVTVWNAIGNHDTHLDLGASTLDLPFQFDNSSTGHTDPTHATQPTNPADPTDPSTTAHTPTDALVLVTTGGHLALQPGTANIIVPPGGSSVSFAATALAGALNASVALHFGLDLDAGSGIGATELRVFYDFERQRSHRPHRDLPVLRQQRPAGLAALQQ